MSDSLVIDLNGRVLSATMREGVSKRTEKPYSIPEVELLTENFDKLVVNWPDGDKFPAVGAGVRCRVRLTGSGYGLGAQVQGWAEHKLEGPLAAIPVASAVPAGAGKG